MARVALNNLESTTVYQDKEEPIVSGFTSYLEERLDATGCSADYRVTALPEAENQTDKETMPWLMDPDKKT